MIDTLIEAAAFKAGIVLTEDEVVNFVRGTSIGDDFLAADQEGGRVSSVEVDEAVAHLLFLLGNISSPNTLPTNIKLYHEYKNDPERLAILQGVQQLYIEVVPRLIDAAVADGQPQGHRIDPESFLRPAAEKFGRFGLDLAMRIIRGANDDLHRSAWGSVRNVDWQDEIELKDLFESENLSTQHGNFFDQRFIDYLDRNFDQIDNMNWRKFEGLVGEFFVREGFRVEMGPGRGDGGVDMRIFPQDAMPGAPPLIIVQCKRQKAKIDMVVVKSVYADVEWEKADSGLIVTTSTFSPGAERIRTARAYKVEAADRQKVREWLSTMKSGG